MSIYLLFILLTSNAVTLRRDLSILFNRIVIKGLSLSSILALNILFVKSLDKGIGLYGGLLHISSFTQSFHIFIFLISSIILNLTAFYPRKVYVKEHSSLFNILLNKFEYNATKISNKMGEQFRIIEYPLIINFIIIGGIFLISTGDLISLFLSIELQSYGLYILCTLYRDSELATSGGLTYFLLGGLSSCFILLGASLIYASSGTTNMEGFYVISSLTEILDLGQGFVFGYNSYYIHLSLLVLSVGFLFKVSAAPFHFWSPDVYDAIPTIVTTFVAIIAKISIFSFLLELVYYTDKPFYHFTWKNSLLLSSLFSLVIGSVLGLTQSRIKRLFAYSTISHVGFILLALNINTIESIQAYIFYILQYTVSNLNAFIILVSIGFTFYIYVYKDNEYKDNLTDKNNSPIQLISQVKGYFYINPILATSLAITIFSFIGVPPLLGFFAKQMVLSAALDNGYVFMALVGILTSVIGAVYYLNVIKQMFFFKHDYKINPSLKDENIKGYIYNYNTKEESKCIEIKPENIVLNSSSSTIISILTLVLTLFIYIPEEIFSSVSILTLILFKP